MHRITLVLSLFLLSFFAECESGTRVADMTGKPPSITAVIQKNMKHLMSLPGVVGIGEGIEEGKPCILVLVSAPSSARDSAIPDSLEGYYVKIDVVGEIRSLK